MKLDVILPDFSSHTAIRGYRSLAWKDMYNDVGDFEIEVETNDSTLSIWQLGHYLWSADREKLMIIEERELTTDIEEGSTLIIKGRAIASMLDRRTLLADTIINGNLQNGIKNLLNNNVIAPTDTSRGGTNLVFMENITDPRVAALTIDTQFEAGRDILDVITTICQDHRLGFEVLYDGIETFVFQLYMGADRSYDQEENPYVEFSPENHNLINSQYIEGVILEKNVAYILSGGETPILQEVSYATEPTGWDRREIYEIASDITDMDGDVPIPPSEMIELLKQRGETVIKQNTKLVAFEGQIEPGRPYTFGLHYYLGDVVQLRNEFGLTSKARVSEMVIESGLSGDEVYPTFVIENEEEEDII